MVNKLKGTEIDENIVIKHLILRADGISSRIDYMAETPRIYENFKYNNGKTIDNLFLLENSLSISSGDYLELYIDSTKLSKPINCDYTKLKLECDLWSIRTTWDYRYKKNTTDHFITSKGIDVTEFRNKKCQYPRFYNNYRDYREFIEDTWKYERITITEKDRVTYNTDLDNNNIIKVFMKSAGIQSCECGMIESGIFSILCPQNKIMSFRSKKDIESYHNGEEVYDAHHLNIYLASD
jgi:hypothetical protein